MQRSYSPQAQLFGKLVAGVGGAGLLLSLYLGSIIPILLSIVALFATLSFMNGLAEAQPKTKHA
jgi:hypothetical protein